jgi:hypothetical protein
VHLDGQHPVLSTRIPPSRSERHGETALVSHTPGGGPGSWRNDNRQRNKGHPFARGNNEQEEQQPTRNQRGARHQVQDPLEANLKPVGIPKYDNKQDPHQWIRCCSVAIEVSGGSNSTKPLYFPVALESAPLTRLVGYTIDMFL